MTLANGELAVAVASDLAFLPVGATGKVLKRRLRGLAETLLAGQHEQALLHLQRQAEESERPLASTGTER